MKTNFLFLSLLAISFYSCGNVQNNAKQDNTDVETQQAVQQDTEPVSILDKLGLEEVECYSGRFTNNDFVPIVIIKFKNASNKPITESINIKGVFIDNEKGEVLYEDNSGYLSATSLQPGLTNKVRLIDNVGVNPSLDADISCQIYINDQLYKTVKIGKDFL